MNYLGYSWVDMNMNLDQAMDLIRKAVDLRPGDGYIVDSLGWAYYKLGKFDDAVRELERAVSLKPDDAVLNDHLGDAYWRAGRRLEATFQWAHARDMKPDEDVLAKRPEEARRRPAAARRQDGRRRKAVPAPTAAPEQPPPIEKKQRARRAVPQPAPDVTAAAGDPGRLHGAARAVAVVDRRRQARQRRALPARSSTSIRSCAATRA